jgi:hypothetical protein
LIVTHATGAGGYDIGLAMANRQTLHGVIRLRPPASAQDDRIRKRHQSLLEGEASADSQSALLLVGGEVFGKGAGMQFVEIKPQHFINAALVREFQYSPAGSAEANAAEQPGGEPGGGAQAETTSSIVVTFSNGDQRVFTGRDADGLFTKLKGTWD